MIEKLIKYYSECNWSNINIRELIDNLKSLQDTTEECKHTNFVEYKNDKWFWIIHRCTNCWHTKIFDDVK